MKPLFLLLILAGCSAGSSWNASMGNGSSPNISTDGTQALILDKQVQGMSRNEVIMAINECESNRTRAVVIMAKQKVSGRTTDVVTDVTCAPKYTY